MVLKRNTHHTQQAGPRQAFTKLCRIDNKWCFYCAHVEHTNSISRFFSLQHQHRHTLNQNNILLVYYFKHHFYLHYLYSAWVKHDTDMGRGSRGRKVGTELGTDNAACTMGTCDLAPDATKFGFFGSLFLLGFVNEGNSFTHVELCFTFVTDVLQFEQRCFFVLISQTTFVTHDKSSNIQTAQNKRGTEMG